MEGLLGVDARDDQVNDNLDGRFGASENVRRKQALLEHSQLRPDDVLLLPRRCTDVEPKPLLVVVSVPKATGDEVTPYMTQVHSY